MDIFYSPVPPEVLKKEREKARVLKKSQWWKQQLGRGLCYHCGQKFSKDELTMDHLIPLGRGGLSTKNNLVVSCKSCNSQKKNKTVAELRLDELKAKQKP